LQYLPCSDSSPNEQDSSEDLSPGTRKMSIVSNGTLSTTQKKQENLSPTSSRLTPSVPGISNHLFSEKLIPILVDLFLEAPAAEMYNIFPEIVRGLGRCMTTRREHPDAALWRLAVEGLNRILVDDVSKVPTCSKPTRMRIWKEVTDVYEIFLLGYCGRALSSNSLSATLNKTDESLEMNILDILGDKVLMSQTDAPHDILHRLISTLDRCASRTCSLPVETVELMPFHCSRFSLTCLHKLFSLSSYNCEAGDWNSSRSDVSKISIMILLGRCEFILKKFLSDESDLGERPLPLARLEEVMFVLQELSQLVLHPETAFLLPLHPNLNMKGGEKKLRTHLLVLFPSFCDLVVSREGRVRELVQVLLGLITVQLGLDKLNLTTL
jgi:hypothetical protein